MSKVSKEEAQFQVDLKRLGDLIGGKEVLTLNKKVSTDILSQIAVDLLKEERENTAKEVKDKLKGILNNYAKMNQEIADKEKELAATKNKKMKEFSEAVKALFTQVETLDAKEKQFEEGLNTATREGAESTSETNAE